METESKEQWWCDWYLSPSNEEYFRKDEQFFFRFIILVLIVETKLFAKKYNIPLVDPMWLEHSIKKRRLIKIDKYQVQNDENQQPAGYFFLE
ncbi:unnamed protein product [Rotaria sp. Silwood1]|nr:unnamed protein product [Rotaria sp. Silwood1]